MHRCVMLIATTFVLFSTGNLLGQSGTTTQQTIEVGTVALSLGMPQEEVLTKLRQSFVLTTFPGFSNLWSVFRRLTDDRELASITFRDGKLDSVSISHGPADQTVGVSFARGLYDALVGVSEQGAIKDCVVAILNKPNAPIRHLSIICGQKRVTITVAKIDGVERAMLSENLGVPVVR